MILEPSTRTWKSNINKEFKKELISGVLGLNQGLSIDTTFRQL